MRPQRQRSGKVWLGAAGVAVAAVALGAFFLYKGNTPEAHAQAHDENARQAEAVAVRVVKPQGGGIERATEQPGTVRAFDFEELYAKVSGYLKNQKVDIGSKVKKGQILAEIDAPELIQDQLHAEAALAQAKSQKKQMLAHLDTAKAELLAATSRIKQKQAEVKQSKSYLAYRNIQYDRVSLLAESGSIDQKIVDESRDQLDAAQARYEASIVGVDTARADEAAARAKVEQAKADIEVAEANIRVAQSSLDRATAFVGFTKIRSDYDGVVTARNFHNGDYIKPGDRGAITPLLIVQVQDKMRLIIQVPDTDAPFCDEGDPVDFKITTTGTTLKHQPDDPARPLKIDRISYSQDQKTRTMRVEVDLQNKKGVLRDGMYGIVTIHLQQGRKDAVRLPSTCLKTVHGKEVVYVVRGGTAHEVPVCVGQNNANQAEILSGVRPGDEVIDHPTAEVRDGVAVAVPRETAPNVAAGH
jgi:RND family efflux transporter MFP subunit